MQKELLIYTGAAWSNKFPGVAGWSFVAVEKGKPFSEEEDYVVHEQSGVAPGTAQKIGGELKAAMAGLLWALNNGYQDVTICYEYPGVEHWVTGTWKAKKELPSIYGSWMQEVSKGLIFAFEKAEVQFGGVVMERSESLAKTAVNQAFVAAKGK